MKKIPVLFLMFFIFSTYLYTLYPCPAPEDSGGYTAIAYLLDIAHAPGNPLYILTGKIFTLIPLGNIAYRLNIMSAVFGLLTIFVIYKIILLVTGRNLTAFIVSSFFAFTYEFWYTATFTKPFTMICFFACLILFCLIKFNMTNNKKYFYLACLYSGLGIGVHYLLVIFVPVLFLALLLAKGEKKNVFRFSVLFVGLFFAVLGLIVYVYLPLRAGRHPLINFGQPDNFRRLMEVLLRKDWSFFKMSAAATSPVSIMEIIVRLKWLLLVLNDHLCTIGLLLSVLGLLSLLRKQKEIFLLICTLIILAGPVWLIFSAFPIVDPFKEAMNERFLPILECFLIIPAGIGLNQVVSYLERISMKQVKYLLLFIFLLPFCFHFFTVNKRYNFLAEDYATNFFRPLDMGSIVFAGQHVNSVSMYYQYVKNKRNDVKRIIEPVLFVKFLREKLGSDIPVYTDPSYNNYFSLPENGFFTGLNIKLNPAVSSWDEIKNIWQLLFLREGYKSGVYKDFYSQMALMWHTEALHGYGQTSLKFKKYDEAINAFKQCISIGEYDDKFAMLRTYNYNKIKAESQNAYMGILDAHILRGDMATVKKKASSLLKSFPHSSLIYQYLSFAYLNSGKIELAADYGQKAVLLEPQNLVARLNLGVIYERLNKYDAAIEQYKQAVMLDDKNETAFFNLATMYYKKKEWEKAITNFLKVISLNPGRTDIYRYVEQARTFSKGK